MNATIASTILSDLNDTIETQTTTPTILLNKWLTRVFGTILIVILFEIWFRNRRVYKLLGNMPGPPRLPILGHAHLLIGLSHSGIVKRALSYLHKYGETGLGFLGTMPVVFVTNPADIEIILGNDLHLQKSDDYRYFQPWFGNGLLISNDNHWRHHRKMIVPTFHQTVLKSFVPAFVKQSKQTTLELDKTITNTINVHDYMSQASVEILLSTAMGIKKLPEGRKCFEYAEAVLNLCDIIHHRQITWYYRLDTIFKLSKMGELNERLLRNILGFTRRIVADRQKNFDLDAASVYDESIDDMDIMLKKNRMGLRDDLDDNDENDVGEKRRLALLDAMVEMTKNPEIEWTEQDIIDEVNTLMFEGHDTTSAGSSFALCLLGIHQDIQDRVYDEQKAIFGDDLERDCTFADTLQMHYLERVIKETLRLYTPVPIIARKVSTDVKLASGPYTVPKDTTVVVSIFATHRREDTYPNALTFNPDNHLPEKVAKRHYYSYIPFSAGPRSCVGRKYAMLMLKVLLSTILRKFKIHSNLKEKDFDLNASIILKLDNGFKISLERRAS